MLETGMEAPDFTLEDKDGEKHSLSDFRGKKVVLYFYPKDNTSGCTLEAKSYEERLKEFAEKNAVVIGISKDSKKSHQSFMEKQNLSFLLLSDENLDVIKMYDVWREKNMYGKKTFGVERSTFLIDEEGKLIEVRRKAKAKEDAELSLKRL